MNLFAISGLACGISCLILAVITLIFGRKKLHFFLFLFNIVVTIWGSGLFLVGIADTEAKALFAWKFAHFGGLFIGILFYHLVCIFCDIKRRKTLYFGYLQAAILNFLNLGSNLIFHKTQRVFDIYHIQPTLLHIAGIFLYLLFVLISYYELINYFRHTKGFKRTQTLYLIFGFLVGFIGGTTVFLPEFGVNIYPIGTFGIPIYCLIITYAILKHKFMDIGIAFSQIAVYVMIFTLFVGIPLGFLFMNTFALAGLSVGIFCLFLSLITLILGKAKIHRILSLFNIAVAVWGFGGFIVGIARNEAMAIFGWKFAHIGGMFVSVLFFHLVCILCMIRRKKLLIFGYSQAIIFNLISWIPDKLITKTRFAYGLYYNDATIIFSLAVLSYILLVSLSFWELVNFVKRSRGVRHTQTLYIIFGFLCGFIGGTSTFLPEFGIDIFYPFGNFGIVLYACVVTYAILKFRLLNIDIALTRAGIFVFVYTLVLGLPFALATLGKDNLIAILGDRWWVAPLGLMAALATSGPYIYLYIQHRAEERLLREQKRYHNILKQASRGMTRIRNLQRLMNLITHILSKTVRIKSVAIYLFDEKKDCFALRSQRDSKKLAYPEEISSSSPLIALLSAVKEPVVYDEMKQRVQDEFDTDISDSLELMSLLEANMIVPTFLEDKFLGFLVLGDKLSGKPYTPEDINVFSVLASQAALAIENAEFYQEAQEMQEQIGQAEKMATIGTMADGLSHQINNRFHALALISGNTLDTLKIFEKEKGVQGKEMRELFDELEYAFGRVQANVIQGGEIVKGLLKYSKKGEEGFKAVSLSEIVENTLEMVQYKVKLAEFELVKDYPEEDHKVVGNLVQLQEVFFNLIDNGYDAIKERKETLKEEGYKGRITISARPKGKSLEIVVEDNGMGVKGDNLKKMFTPFFTTKATANKGTGLGLYVIRRIISEMHKGSVEVESEHGKGTRFIIRLPLA